MSLLRALFVLAIVGTAPRAAAQATSVVVLDLNRNSHADVVSPWDAKLAVTFDFDGSGLMQRTGWVAAGDGMLVLDRNGNGRIDSGSELFANYAALRAFDDNQDGVITAADAVFTQLALWQDLNHNGISEARELKSLAQWDMTTITHSAAIAGENRYRLYRVDLTSRRTVVARRSLTER